MMNTKDPQRFLSHQTLSDENDDSDFIFSSPEQQPGQEVSLRPKNFQEYIGQKMVVANIEIMMKSALKRDEAMDHILLSGPPGLGKTSLAYLLAKELGVELHVVSAPMIEKKGDLAATLTNLSPRDILFIDEIHRLPMPIEEILYSAMEDFRLDILIGQGPTARTMQIDLPRFTLVGATTKSGQLTQPLRDRFLAHLHFHFYQAEELAQIIEHNARKMKINLHPQAKLEMAKRSRGTPRLANRILRRVRDFAFVHEVEQVSLEEVHKALKLLEIDELGLDRMDRKILTIIWDYYQGGPVGIESLCSILNEERSTIEDVYEPYLLQEGYILRTPRGRKISEKALKYLKYLEKGTET